MTQNRELIFTSLSADVRLRSALKNSLFFFRNHLMSLPLVGVVYSEPSIVGHMKLGSKEEG